MGQSANTARSFRYVKQGSRRTELRYAAAQHPLKLSVEGDEVALIDYSAHGLGVVLPFEAAPGTEVTLDVHHGEAVCAHIRLRVTHSLSVGRGTLAGGRMVTTERPAAKEVDPTHDESRRAP